MSKAYPSNLTRAHELLSEMIPKAKPGGRPREVDMWEILNAIFYVLVEGVRWRSLPGDFPAWQTVYTYSHLAQRRNFGNCMTVCETGQESSRSVIGVHQQSSTVKVSSGDGESIGGYDAGKHIKGRKRFLTVDSLGLVLRVLVTTASVGEREGGKQVLKQVKRWVKACHVCIPFG